MRKFPQWLPKVLSYVLVAAIASAISFMIAGFTPTSKLDVLEKTIQKKFIGQVDETAVEDAAADAMVRSLGDRWSYYISAENYDAIKQNKTNSYVGIGVTIQAREDGTGYDIKQVEPEGPAQKAGILPEDIIVRVQGEDAAEMDLDQLKSMIQGQAGTKVEITVLRAGQERTFQVTRAKIQVQVAKGQMLPDQIGLVTIRNFNDNCAKESIQAVDTLVEQGAEALIFDVRNNGGGYLAELEELLDHLLPGGVIYSTVDYKGTEIIKQSDKDCIELPMAVLINGDTYSAAEFFAAALEEYDWAVTVGEQTVGKGYFQYLLDLPDGSAVNLSTGKYLTPNGVNLQEAGGLTPKEEIPVDDHAYAMIAAELVQPEEDPQIQKAVEVLLQN